MFSIGTFSKTTGCPIETIRYYERIGLLAKPLRSSGGHRLYNTSNVQQLAFVIKARQMKFSLAEVKQLLQLSQDKQQSCQEVLSIADRNLEAIQLTIDKLNALKNELAGLSNTCKSCCASNGSASDCNIIDSMKCN